VATELATYLAVFAANVLLRVVVKYTILTPLGSAGSSTMAVLVAAAALSSWR